MRTDQVDWFISTGLMHSGKKAEHGYAELVLAKANVEYKIPGICHEGATLKW